MLERLGARALTTTRLTRRLPRPSGRALGPARTGNPGGGPCTAGKPSGQQHSPRVAYRTGHSSMESTQRPKCRGKSSTSHRKIRIQLVTLVKGNPQPRDTTYLDIAVGVCSQSGPFHHQQPFLLLTTSDDLGVPRPRQQGKPTAKGYRNRSRSSVNNRCTVLVSIRGNPWRWQDLMRSSDSQRAGGPCTPMGKPRMKWRTGTVSQTCRSSFPHYRPLSEADKR